VKEAEPLQTKIQSRALQQFAEAAETIVNPEVKNWKDAGGKIVGYFCTAMPTEMVTAAGFLPFRVRATGSTETDLSDSCFSSINCSFPRHAFNMALKGEYDFLDALVMFNSCDHIRRVYDHWTRRVGTPFLRILSLPKKAEPAQVRWFRSELSDLREGMQEHFGVEISDDALRQAIVLHNKSRRTLRAMYDLRKADSPPITGAEMLAVTVAGTAMPQGRYNQLLDQLLHEVGQNSGRSDSRARLMVIGGELDNPEYLKVIEDQGGLVVTDAVCFGSRMIWADVDESADDPLTALAQYYVVDRPSCARMFTEYPRRVDFIKNMIRDFKVDGVIFQRLTFCELWGFEQYSLTNDFKELNVPLLCMDREYTLSGVGQVRTRVQAFLETIER
jgi:benzoyl-CoA reductase/2-hydroxyglutaryl-CoA dehydratase subunit BcrC/BadD/HgdB